MRNNTRNWMGMVIVGIVCLVIGDVIGLRNGDGMVIGHGDGTETVVGHLRPESPDAPVTSTVETIQTIYRVVTRWAKTEYQDAHESRSHEQTLLSYAELGLATADLMKTARATSATLGWIEPEAANPAHYPWGLPETCRIFYADGSTTSWSVAPPEGVSRYYDYYQIWYAEREPEPVIQEWIGPGAGLPLTLLPDDYTIHFPTMLDPGIVMPPDPVPESPSHIERGFFGSHTMTKAVADEVERQKAINRAREAGK